LIAGRRLETIRLTDVALDRPLLVCTVRGPAQELVDSVKTVGMINPPVVRGPEVVCGYRRLLAAQALGWDRVTAWIVSESELTPGAAVELGLRDNLGHRGVSEAEKARAVEILIRRLGLPTEWVRTHVLPLLGRAPRARVVRTYLAVGSSSRSVLHLLDEGRIGLGTAHTLASLSEADQRDLCRLLGSLGTGTNTGREIVEGLVDLALREERNIRSVLADDWIAAALEPHDRSTTVRQFVQALRLRRQPGYQAGQRADMASAARWSRLAGAQLEIPPGREGGSWYCKMRFRTPEELRSKLMQVMDERRLAELEALMGAAR
jgi:hypothetical protein